MSREKESNMAGSSLARILVPIDGSENSNRALRLAATIAKSFDSEIFVLNVIPAPNALIGARTGLGLVSSSVNEYYSEQEVDANQFVENASSLLKSKDVTRFTTELVRASNSVVEEIIQAAASRKIDLIVIGTRGLGRFRKLLQGSVSSGVLANASCDVLVVR